MLRNLFARRFSLGFVLIVSLVVAGAAAWVMSARTRSASTQTGNPDYQALKDQYGPARNSYGPEEWIARDFFKDQRDGVFVDVGANHYRITSNTYYLEHELGWSGIAIEPQKEFMADYATFRPRTRFFPFFISDVSNQTAKLYVLEKNSQISSGRRGFTEQQGKKAQELDVPTITLNDLLDSEKVRRIDYLSIDIELWEPKALAGFDIDRFRPRLVCIEVHIEVRQQILDYFARHGYVVVGKYLRADENNLHFAPMS
jgi:FkbM family methyltransferase